ncbi:hypothetical protein ACTFIU_009061 [Dictyostelium citrinum]
MKKDADSDSVPNDYKLSDTLLDQYKPLINNQGLLFEGEFILKKRVNSIYKYVLINIVSSQPIAFVPHLQSSYNTKASLAPLYEDNENGNQLGKELQQVKLLSEQEPCELLHLFDSTYEDLVTNILANIISPFD